ncbi:hypothetical protein [Athalassotoga sp.]|uniref:hypothetical protein n=1 Tax=Athalassotoga sp. TaxID=2022597 RepID=UPI003D02E8EB
MKGFKKEEEKKMWTKGFMKEFHRAFARVANKRKLWWEMICVPSGTKENEWGLPLIKRGQGRNRDYYDPSQVKGTKRW